MSCKCRLQMACPIRVPEAPPVRPTGQTKTDAFLPQVLRSKYTVTNRAPVMMAWAVVVAERLGFQREEALSIGAPFGAIDSSWGLGCPLGLCAAHCIASDAHVSR